MNPNLLDRLSPRPACPLVRLGRSTPLQQPSSSRLQDANDYYALATRNYDIQQSRATTNRLHYDHHYDETPFQHQQQRNQPSERQPSSHERSTNNSRDHVRTPTSFYTGTPYQKQPNLDLTSLSLSAGLGYWEHDNYSKSIPSSSDSSHELFDNTTHRFTKPSQTSGGSKQKRLDFGDSDYLMDNYLKLGKNSPGLDQGYHTLVPASSGCVTPNSWLGEPHTQIARGKSRLHVRNNSFDRLSDDLIVQIFSSLKSYELSVCARVCRRFEHLVWRPELWRTLTFAGSNLSADRAIRAILRQLCGQGTTGACTQVESVHITDGAHVSDKGIILLARRCPEITHLQINMSTGVTTTSLNEIVHRCGNLQHLDVTGCVQVNCLINMMGPDPVKRLQLQYLDLTDCTSLQDNGLRIIFRNCPLLAYLYLRRCTEISDAGLKFVPSFCASLRELSVSGCVNITDFALYELAKLGPNLRYLSVAKCDQVSDAGLKVVARRCYKMRYLNVRGCEAVSDDAITLVARSCTRLRSLDVGKCDVSDAGLRALAECCPNLKKLGLRNCDLVTDRGVQAIAYYCRGLRQLNIQDCQISLDGYRAVKKFCKRCTIEHTNPGFF